VLHLPRGARILVAVSGGGDSVALLHRLRASPFELMVGHVHHGLRASADADAHFVQRLADAWDFPCRILHANVRQTARRQKMSIEEAGRFERYRLLGQLAKTWKCEAIVTAHSADDQAETVLMNFFRGSGPVGLAGIAPARPLAKGSPIQLVRPVLEISRATLRTYLAKYSLTFREDPSNRHIRFTRNRIRHKLLPELEKQFPGLRNRLINMAGIFRYYKALGRR